jgi:hypothetical protein
MLGCNCTRESQKSIDGNVHPLREVSRAVVVSDVPTRLEDDLLSGLSKVHRPSTLAQNQANKSESKIQ